MCGACAFEVERGELVERAFPLAAGLEFDAIVGPCAGPCGGVEELADVVGPVGEGLLFVIGFVVGDEPGCGALQAVELPEEAWDAGISVGALDLFNESGKIEFGAQESCMAKLKGVELPLGGGARAAARRSKARAGVC